MAYSLGEISALVTLDKQEFDRGIDSLPGFSLFPTCRSPERPRGEIRGGVFSDGIS